MQPHLGGNLSYAGADLETGYGRLSVHWKIADGKFNMDVEIPPNTSASVYLPAATAELIAENGKPLSASREIKISGKEGNYIVLQTGSGSYHFSTDIRSKP